MLTDLHNRGVQDILIACVDGLKGFPEAIQAIFPNTEVQLCVIHQIRNSIRYVASKDQKAFMRDLKPVYKAVNKESAELALDEFDRLWGSKYPAVIDVCQHSCHPYLNQATKTSLALTRLDRRTGLSAVG